MSFNTFGTQSSWPDGTTVANQAEGNISSGRTGIRDLAQGMQNIIIVGVVIAKQEMHSFADKKNPENTERAHVHFTLRDSPTDFINVNCWGSTTHISNLTKVFKIGDVVEVRNPQVQGKLNTEAEERWKPWTSSPFQLNLSEAHSSVSLYSGWDTSDFDVVTHIPIKASNDYYTLSDIIANGQNLHGEHINIQAVVKSMGTPKDIITKTGKHIRRCEVKLFDEMCPSFPLVLWSEEFIELAQTWIPKDNILFIADAKVTFDDYRKAMVSTCDQKTIITTNPDTREAHQLYMYAQSVETLDDDTDELNGPSVALDSIKTVLTVHQLKTRLLSWDDVTDQESGILYAFLTEMDIDTAARRFIVSRCAQCGQKVDGPSGVCFSADCPAANNMNSQVKTQYEIPTNLSDHTGTLQCRLTGKCAESMLGCTPTEFLDMTPHQCTEMKFKYLLERCKVYFKIVVSGKRFVRLLSCSLADPSDTAVSFLQPTTC